MAYTVISVAEGDYVDYTPGADVGAGQVVVQADLLGVTTRAISANTKGALAVAGIFKFPCANDEAIPAGTKVYWDATNEVATATATDNTYIGKAVAAAAQADTTVLVRLSQ